MPHDRLKVLWRISRTAEVRERQKEEARNRFVPRPASGEGRSALFSDQRGPERLPNKAPSHTNGACPGCAKANPG